MWIISIFYYVEINCGSILMTSSKLIVVNCVSSHMQKYIRGTFLIIGIGDHWHDLKKKKDLKWINKIDSKTY